MNRSNSNSVKSFFNKPRGRNSSGAGDGSGNGLMNWLMWLLIALLVIIIVVLIVFAIGYFTSDCKNKKDFATYVFDMDVMDACAKDGSGSGADALGQGSGEGAFLEREVKNEDEVFLIGDQVYNYDEAKCKCNSYGSKLATREQVIDSYNKGADTCLYGWSEGQNAFYTTQKCTWDKLQKGPKSERGKCGMPGVNGGYFANPNIKFGALCYGIRPEGEVAVEKKPVCNDKQPFCKLAGDAVKKNDGDNVVPFSGTKWSQWRD